MDTLRGLTDQINVFVRFFESINYLFCQVRWLEQNIQNSSKGLLLVVGVICLICFYVFYSPSTDGGGDPIMAAISGFVVSYFPILAVVLLVVYFLARRFSGSTDGQLGDGGGFESILYGSQHPQQNADGLDDDVESRLHPKAVHRLGHK